MITDIKKRTTLHRTENVWFFFFLVGGGGGRLKITYFRTRNVIAPGGSDVMWASWARGLGGQAPERGWHSMRNDTHSLPCFLESKDANVLDGVTRAGRPSVLSVDVGNFCVGKPALGMGRRKHAAEWKRLQSTARWGLPFIHTASVFPENFYVYEHMRILFFIRVQRCVMS